MISDNASVGRVDIGEVVVERLHALVERGYRPELGFPGSGAVSLKHPGKAPPVTLWADGQLLDAFPTFVKDDIDRIIIEPEDKEGFERFLSRIPALTLPQKIAQTSLSDGIFIVIVGMLFLIFIWISEIILDKAYDAIRGMLVHL